MTTTFIGVNGVLTDGSTNTDRMLLRLAENYNCKVFDFKYRRVNYLDIGIRLRRHRSNKFVSQIANRLIETQQKLNQPVSIIAHSFGCLVTLRALQMGLVASNVYLFAPAVNENEFIDTTNVNNVFVIHNENDFTIKLGSLLLFHDFGLMGVNGAQNRNDSKVINVSYDTPNAPTLFGKLSAIFDNHGSYFFEHNIVDWIQFIAKHCELDTQ
jgi:hypothetical protein